MSNRIASFVLPVGYSFKSPPTGRDALARLQRGARATYRTFFHIEPADAAPAPIGQWSLTSNGSSQEAL